MNSYQKFLTELEALAKSFPAEGEGGGEGGDGKGDDKTIAAAAAEGAAAGDADDKGKEKGKDKGEGKGAEGGAAGEENLGKSMTVTLASGEQIEAVDGTELVKALIGRVEEGESALSKALGFTASISKALQANLVKANAKLADQDKLIKSFGEKLDKISGEGKGRKTVLNIHDKDAGGELPLNKSLEGLSPRDFMLKAFDAQTAGKLTGTDVAQCESYLNRGLALPDHLVKKVLG